MLSVRPKYAELILSGRKTVELRRVRPQLEPGDCIVMYVSSPLREVQALLLVEEVIQTTPTALWKEVGAASGVTEEEYAAYFEGSITAVGFRIRVVENLKAPLPLTELRRVSPGFYPPQSFRYLDRLGTDLRALLASVWTQPIRPVMNGGQPVLATHSVT